MKIACILAAAFLLDCLLGDPRWLPHPICLIGKLIACTEKGMRRLVKNEFLGGLLLVIVVITVSTAVPWAILFLAGMINPWVETVLQVWFCYQILAMKSLRTESMRVYTPLKAGDLPLARKYLSWIVGRETDRLDEEGVAKAAVETVAENTSVGVVAPLIFMAIGGAPLGFLYKAINTMDSMVGYKNDKYIRFGRAAARLDDAANFIPARLSALLMILAVYILRFDGGNARRIYRRDRHNHKSPNSAQTESVCAGALHIQLAGPAVYFGQLVEKPTIGDRDRPTTAEDIRLTNRLMIGTSVLAVLLMIGLRLAAWGLLLLLG